MIGCVLVAAALLGCPDGAGPAHPPPAAFPAAPPAAGGVFEVPGARDAMARDAWLGEDKTQHFAMSFAATAFAYAGARVALDRQPARAAAAATALAAGVAKEIHDSRAGRFFSVRDMAWNVAGVAMGMALVSQVR